MKIRDLAIETYFQRLWRRGAEPFDEIELLSRPHGITDVDGFFTALDVESYMDLLRLQVDLAARLRQKFGVTCALNVHNSVIADAQRARIFLQLAESQSSPLIFEFTEKFPMPTPARSNQILRELRELGHRSALDDFGIGLNGMLQLTEYDFDIVKLDKSLCSDIAKRRGKRTCIKLIGRMLTALGKSHVVEGVEDGETLELLEECGFTTFQGYFLHRPAPIKDLRAN